MPSCDVCPSFCPSVRHVRVCPSFCPSVSHVRVLPISKWINMSSFFFHCRVATPVFHTKRYGNIPMGTPELKITILRPIYGFGMNRRVSLRRNRLETVAQKVSISASFVLLACQCTNVNNSVFLCVYVYACWIMHLCLTVISNVLILVGYLSFYCK